MKDGFTLIEVSILFVIFILVAVLIIPLSVDDVILSKNIDRWKQSQLEFSTIPITLMNSENYKSDNPLTTQDFMAALIRIYPLKKVVTYKIKYLNGDTPEPSDSFSEIFLTDNGASIAFKWLESNSVSQPEKPIAKIMYDVNGKSSPNTWGKDIFGLNVYKNKVVPFGSELDDFAKSLDGSRHGTGLACSALYLKGKK